MVELIITHRRLPYWTLDGAWYYVTFRLRTISLSHVEIQIVLDHLKSGHGKYYRLIAACVMPDHVHLILSPREGYSISRVMKGIKGVTARELNRHRGTGGVLWQDESWDRILRDDQEFQQKFNYALMNPVVAGLAPDPWTYEGWYCGQ